MNYRMVIKGCEALSMLVKACPLPVGGKGRSDIVFYETVTGHIKHWAENGPFKFESATVFEENGTVPLCQLTDIELSDFKIIPSPADAVDLVLYAPTISWADAAPVPQSKTIVIETANLEGLALGWAVAKALGWVDYPEDSKEQGGWWYTDPEKAPFCERIYKADWKPTTDWRQAGELVDDHIKRMGDCAEPVNGWDAIPEGKQCFAMAHNNEFATGATKRIAVCRAVVLAKLGTSVEVPAVLVSQ